MPLLFLKDKLPLQRLFSECNFNFLLHVDHKTRLLFCIPKSERLFSETIQRLLFYSCTYYL